MAFTSPSDKKPAKGSKTTTSSKKTTKTSANKVTKTSTGSKTSGPTSFKGSQNETRVEKQWQGKKK